MLFVLLCDFLVCFPVSFRDKKVDNQCLGHTDHAVEDEETGGVHDGDHWVGGLDSHKDHEELVAEQDHRHQQLDVSKEPFSFQYPTQNILTRLSRFKISRCKNYNSANKE